MRGYTLIYKLLGGAALPAPGADACGTDPTADELTECSHGAALCPA